jgi:hypothetical protein
MTSWRVTGTGEPLNLLSIWGHERRSWLLRWFACASGTRGPPTAPHHGVHLPAWRPYSLDFPKIAVWSGHVDRHSTEPSASLALIAFRALSQLDPDAQVEVLHQIEQLAHESRRERP